MLVHVSNTEPHEKDGSGSPFGDDNTAVIMWALIAYYSCMPIIKAFIFHS